MKNVYDFAIISHADADYVKRFELSDGVVIDTRYLWDGSNSNYFQHEILTRFLEESSALIKSKGVYICGRCVCLLSQFPHHTWTWTFRINYETTFHSYLYTSKCERGLETLAKVVYTVFFTNINMCWEWRPQQRRHSQVEVETGSVFWDRQRLE